MRKLVLTAVFLIILLVGWYYPLLGLGVGVVMILGMVIGPFKSRLVCAKVCPRGAFLDSGISKVSLKNKLPKIFRKAWFRWTIVGVLMGTMGVRTFFEVNSITSLGFLFWSMCAATSVVAIYLGVKYNHRAWCAICPMGTIQENLYKLGKGQKGFN